MTKRERAQVLRAAKGRVIPYLICTGCREDWDADHVCKRIRKPKVFGAHGEHFDVEDGFVDDEGYKVSPGVYVGSGFIHKRDLMRFHKWLGRAIRYLNHPDASPLSNPNEKGL